MTPTATFADIVDDAWQNAIGASQPAQVALLAEDRSPNGVDVGFGEDGSAIRFAAKVRRHPCTPLRHTITPIVQIRPEKEMIRPYAVSDIAMMADMSAVGNRAVVKFPRMSVDEQLLGLTAMDDAITALVATASPQPATIRFLNV